MGTFVIMSPQSKYWQGHVPPVPYGSTPLVVGVFLLLNTIACMHNCRPHDTPFEDGTFKLTMEFSEDYPNKPPSVRFVSTMFHPNGLTLASSVYCCVCRLFARGRLLCLVSHFVAVITVVTCLLLFCICDVLLLLSL